ncbi:MAG TPA: hypothetical protein VIE36_20230 [Methylomirabilota bacterium]|jgi:hypothetical protein
MTLCSLCGMQLASLTALCAHHDRPADHWAAQNRIMCNLLHRGVVPPRLPVPDRAENVVVTAEAA